jgi:hypothetical protein
MEPYDFLNSRSGFDHVRRQNVNHPGYPQPIAQARLPVVLLHSGLRERGLVGVGLVGAAVVCAGLEKLEQVVDPYFTRCANGIADELVARGAVSPSAKASVATVAKGGLKILTVILTGQAI